MATDVKQGYKDASSKINSYKTTISTQANEKVLEKLSAGNNFEMSKSESTKQLNAMGDKKQRLQSEIKNQFEELIDLVKASIPSNPTSNSKTIDFLLKQVLSASQNTKSRISEVIVDEALSVAGCSQEQTFDGSEVGAPPSSSPNKIYIRVNQIDLFKLLNKDPNEGNNKILYELNQPVTGSIPFSMDRELYNRLQNEGTSLNSEYGSDYIGASGKQIMDVNYVTSYVKDGTTYYGDFYEITLRNRPNLNRISDFLRDYYKSIDMLNFDGLMVKIMNSLSNFIDISAKLSGDEKEEQSKFEKTVQRILGLCFDNNKEIDVSGTAKLSSLDNIDESFFEMTPLDLKNIENEVNNMINGVTEFEDCGNVKLPVDVQSIVDDISEIREIPDNQKVDAFIQKVENMSKNDNWKLKLPDGINIDIAIKDGILKLIPRAVIMTILSPKTLLGLMIVLKSLGSAIINEIEDFPSFMKNMKKFIINISTKIMSIFVEELFKLLKANIRKLVETLMVEIVKESKNAQAKIIAGVLYVLLQLASAVIDWRQCKSVVDEILNLLNLALPGGSRPPTFALAGAGLLPGFSPTRAMANVTENIQKLGLPTGDMPDGSPNIALPAMFQQVKGVNDEKLSNSATHTWCAPVAVGLVATGPIRCSGKET
jgi:hypothetical protein